MLKKLLLTLAFVGVFLFAANDVLIVGNAAPVVDTWTGFIADTITSHVDSGVVTVKFDKTVYNLNVTALGGATTDTATVWVYSNSGLSPGFVNYTGKATDHTVAVPRGLYTMMLGNLGEADTIKFYYGIKEFSYYLDNALNDSDRLFKFWGVYK